jgi:hypothetical protein
MIYSQFRENEKTDRYEVRVNAGYGCVLKDAGLSTKASWQIAKPEEAFWVDLEAELERILQRSDLDYGLMSNGSASEEFLSKIRERKDDLYDLTRNDRYLGQDYLAQLGMVNLAEYFRLLKLRERASGEFDRGASAVGMDNTYLTARTRALELDQAELSEWLIAHGIGLPDLSLFNSESIPETAMIVAAPIAIKKKKKKGEAADESESAPQEAEAKIPSALFYIAELYRLHQATEHDLLKFVDQVQYVLALETPTAAIEVIKASAAPWIDVTSFEQRYTSFKKEQALETARTQAALLRQHDVFGKKPKRGDRPVGKSVLPRRKIVLDPKEEELSPLEEFTRSFEVDEDDAYEQAMERALELPEGSEGEFLPEKEGQYGEEQKPAEVFAEADEEPFSNSDEDQLFGSGEPQYAGEQQYNDGPYVERPYSNDGPYINDGPYNNEAPYSGPLEQNGPFAEGQRQFPNRQPRHARNRRKPARDNRMPPPIEQRQQPMPVPRGRNPFPPQNGPRRGAPKQNGPIQNGPPKKKGGTKKQGGGGGGYGGTDFDNVQPLSNYSPGLPPTGEPGSPRARPAPKGRWKGKH